MAKFTAARADRFLTLIADGNTVINAAKAVGVNPCTVYEWRKRDARFARRLLRAQAQAEVTAVALINLAAETDWRCAAFLLERRYPRTWGARTKLGVVEKVPPAVHHSPASQHGALDRRLRAARDRHAAGGATVLHLPFGTLGSHPGS